MTDPSAANLAQAEVTTRYMIVPCDECGSEVRRLVHRITRNRKIGSGIVCSRTCQSKRSVRARFPEANMDIVGTHLDKGYVIVRSRREHRAIVESVLGKSLPVGSVVHHVNGDRSDNRHSNLVACQNQAYHQLLHARERIMRAGGDPAFEKICSTCQQIRPHRDFNRHRASNDGRGWRCKKCQSATRKPRKGVCDA